MEDLINMQVKDFKPVASLHRSVTGKQPMHSFFKVKKGSYVIPHTEHKITKLPQGLL